MPLPLLIGVVLWAVVGFAIGAIIDIIWDWFEENKDLNSEYGEIIKEKLASGDYRVQTGIFNKHDVKTASNTWQVDELDDELKELMGRKKRIIVEL